MITAIVFFVLGYFTHKHQDLIVTKIKRLTDKINDLIDSKR